MGTPVASVRQFVEFRIFQYIVHDGFIVIPARNENVENVLIRQFALLDDDHDCRIDNVFRIERQA